MGAYLWIPVLAPCVVAVGAAVHRRGRWTAYAPLTVAVAVLACGLGLLLELTGLRVVTGEGQASSAAVSVADGLLRADTLSAYLLFCVGAVALTAVWGGLPSRDLRREEDGHFAALMCAFLAAMSLAVLADNLGVLWVAVEATTIATAFLVGYRGGRGALEAAWKYVVLGSVGVAIAFLGVVLLYAASRAGGEPTLSWTVLASGSHAMTPALTKIGVALAALGFATKAGLAPMHSWLPDAHSQAPAPVSGLMSGVLLSVAFYAILRIRAIGDVALGPDLMRWMLLAGGLLSIGVAALLTLTQKDYKRLLAYSSIEHMGIMALGAAAGSRLALAAVLLHILGHGLTKSAMFVVSGRILATYRSHHVADVRELLRRRPDLGVPFLVGAAALLGFPPFVTFFTEVAILIAVWQEGLGWATVVTAALLLLVFTGISRHVLAMVLGRGGWDGPDHSEPLDTPLTHADHPSRIRDVPIALALASTAVLAFLAVPLGATIADAVSILAGAR